MAIWRNQKLQINIFRCHLKGGRLDFLGSYAADHIDGGLLARELVRKFDDNDDNDDVDEDDDDVAVDDDCLHEKL